jgi:hypothetical protein
MLKSLDDILTRREKREFCDWIYCQQIEPRPGTVKQMEYNKLVVVPSNYFFYEYVNVVQDAHALQDLKTILMN